MRKYGVEILWLIALIALVIVMGVLLVGGGILLYLAPRMVPMVWFGWAALIALCVYQAGHVWRSISEGRADSKLRLGSLLFLIPVVLLMTVPPNADTLAALPNRNVQILNFSQSTAAISAGASVSPSTTPGETSAATQPSATASQPAAISPQPTASAQPLVETIEVSDAIPCVLSGETVPFDPSVDQFTDCIYSSAEELDGQTVTLYGYVFKDPSFPDNTIMVARLFIYCCSADAYIVGFHVRVEDTDVFKEDSWIRVTGTVRVFSFDYEGETQTFPILTDGSVTACDPPDAEAAYIYP